MSILNTWAGFISSQLNLLSTLFSDDNLRTIAWIVAILFVAVLFITRYNPLRLVLAPIRFLMRLFGRVFRILTKPFQSLRGAGKSISRTAQPTADNIGIFGPIARLFGTETLTDQLLKRYDANEDEFFERHRGLFFEWVHPHTSVVPDPARASEERTQEEVYKSHYLFQFDIPISEMLEKESSQHQYFYEDVESQLIIRMFRGHDTTYFEQLQTIEQKLETGEELTDADKAFQEKTKEEGPDDKFYHIGNRMRKVINSNVRRLATWQTLILSFVLLANIFFSRIYDGVMDMTGYRLLGDATSQITPGDSFTLILFVFAFAFILILNILYHFSQRNNARELDTFITRYLTYINARFRAAEADVNSAVSTRGENAKEQVRDSIIRIQWLAWRAFFMEKYMRAIFYQIKRNTFNYMLFVPIAFTIVTIFAYIGLKANGAPSESFVVKWQTYQVCTERAVSPEERLQCARRLARVGGEDVFYYLSTYSNCVRYDEDGKCQVTIYDRVADRIVAPQEDDPRIADPISEEAKNAIAGDSETRANFYQENERNLFSLSRKIRKEERLASQWTLFVFLFFIQICWYIYNLLRAPLTVRNSIDERGWIEFHKLELENTIRAVVTRMLDEISNWRDRFSGTGGGGGGFPTD